MRDITNIRGHRIRWRLLAAQGAIVGSISAVIMLFVAMGGFPLFNADTDMWTFLKGVSAVVLGGGAATPITGFEFGPVVVGLILHFAIGAIAGGTYGLLIALFDLEGWTPVALFGLIYGAMLFVWSTALLRAGIGPESTESFPLAVMFWSNLAFGLCAGMLLATWADTADIDQPAGERVAVFEQDPPARSVTRLGD